MSEPAPKTKTERTPGPPYGSERRQACGTGMVWPGISASTTSDTFTKSRAQKSKRWVWGREGAPGLLLLHGNGAHADWWSFIAPYLANDFRVAAMSWSGYGRLGLAARVLGGSEYRGGFYRGSSQWPVRNLPSSRLWWVTHSADSRRWQWPARRGHELRSVVLLDTPLWVAGNAQQPKVAARPFNVNDGRIDVMRRWRKPWRVFV